MISPEFINECCSKVFNEPVAIKLNVPFWLTVTKEMPIKYMRMMTLQDPSWLFFVLPKKTPEKELRELLGTLSPYCIDYYFII